LISSFSRYFRIIDIFQLCGWLVFHSSFFRFSEFPNFRIHLQNLFSNTFRLIVFARKAYVVYSILTILFKRVYYYHSSRFQFLEFPLLRFFISWFFDYCNFLNFREIDRLNLNLFYSASIFCICQFQFFFIFGFLSISLFHLPHSLSASSANLLSTCKIFGMGLLLSLHALTFLRTEIVITVLPHRLYLKNKLFRLKNDANLLTFQADI